MSNQKPLWISYKPYWFKPEGIPKLEKNFNDAKYMGSWCIKTKNGNWSEEPVEIFYQANPDTSKGHSHYLGIFIRGGSLYVTRGDTAFEEPIYGLIGSDNEVIVSRYRHDFVQSGSVFVDGGRDYFRRGGHDMNTVKVFINGGDFSFSVEPYA